MDPLTILQQKFGYNSFRFHQEAIVHNVLARKDTFVLMPTGGGKSICYQVPALLLEGITIVISPLIALMKDQVDALRVNGIEAEYLNSTQSFQQQEEIIEKARSKKLKLLYLAPERLIGNPGFLNTLVSFEISLIAIDEAHCISHWGHDFRPEYLMLAKLKQALPDVPVIALTATADKLTQKDILEKLELRNPEIFVSSFNRPNIRYVVEPKKDSFGMLLEFLEKRKEESGIIYCLSRKSTERLAADLVNEGYLALPYHAGLDRDLRARHQEMFIRDEVKIIVATIAFGMGIDKSNVRYVVHMDLPKNIESYYQETGRAGRDGLDSEALLFYSVADVMKLRKFVQIEENEAQSEIALRKLEQMSHFGELRTCRRKYLLEYFNEAAGDFCGNCDICLHQSQKSKSNGNRFSSSSSSTQEPGLAYETTLFQQLKEVRKQLASTDNVAAYIVLADSTLIEMATYLPQTLSELHKMSGFGLVKLQKYGAQFLNAIQAYCQANGLTSRVHLKTPKNQRKTRTAQEIVSNTRQQSFELYQQGKSIAEIASIRGLNTVTIENHLAFYIQNGKLKIEEFLDAEKLKKISDVIELVGGIKLSPFKEALGENYTYGEIKYVIAHIESMKAQEVGEEDFILID
jgi:RecQ family ATP-dependent DNA helicase